MLRCRRFRITINRSFPWQKTDHAIGFSSVHPKKMGLDFEPNVLC